LADVTKITLDVNIYTFNLSQKLQTSL